MANMAAWAAGSLIRGAARAAVRKYGARAAVAGLGTATGYRAYKVVKKKGSRPNTSAYKYRVGGIKRRIVGGRRVGPSAGPTTPRYMPGAPATRRNMGPVDTTERGTITDGDQGGYAQHTTYSQVTGNKKSEAVIAQQIVNRSLETCVGISRNLTQFTGDNGQVPLSHYMDTTNAKRRLPVYLMDLTHVPRGTQELSTQGHFHRLYLNDPAGEVGWEQVRCMDNATPPAVTFPHPYIVYASPGANTQLMWDNICVDKFYINLNLYGQTNRPTTFHVSLVQFDGDELTPVDDMNSTTVAVAAKTSDMADYWSTFSRRLVGNPLSEWSAWTKSKSKVKVLKTKTIKIGPTSTVESDPDPHCVTIKWVHNYGKLVDYKKIRGNQPSVDENYVQSAQVIQDALSSTTAPNWTPRAKDRVYLLVSSTAWTPNTGAGAETVAATTSASFEYSVKTVFKYMP